MNALSLFIPAVALAATLTPAGQQRPQTPTRGAASGAPLALSTLSPRQIGPAVTSGRVISIAVHPTDKTTWYVGAACGGVWKTTNNGTTFTPIFDNEASYSIGTITIDPKRPNIIWVGTGENNAQRSVGWGDGVYKSEDGGRTWKNMGLKSSEHIGKIVVDPRNPDTVWVAAQGPLWSAGGERGLYRTTDGGKTWKNMLAISENTGVSDFLIDPQNPDILYAVSWQ
ncbi:MAG: WD40/YVTN/BNR-like repeat-containing protein, partial [Armatimonadaceae bacterium]